jgi:hypothetical protein
MARADHITGASPAPEPEFPKDPETGITTIRGLGERTLTSEEVYKLQEEEGIEDALQWIRRRRSEW